MHQLGEGQGQRERRHEQEKQWIPFNAYNVRNTYIGTLFIERVYYILLKVLRQFFFNIIFLGSVSYLIVLQ